VSDELRGRTNLADLNDPVANALLTAWHSVKSTHCQADRDREGVLFAAILDAVAPLLAEKDAEIERLRAELGNAQAMAAAEIERWADAFKSLVDYTHSVTRTLTSTTPVFTGQTYSRGVPRVWRKGDNVEAPRDLLKVRDAHREVWSRSSPDKAWMTDAGGCWPWHDICDRRGPLTEVVSDGD
jgi:hypothetical protein